MAARLIDSRQAGLWRGRSLFVIADGADQGVWAAFLNAALRDAQPHVLLLVGEDDCRSIGGVLVDRLSADALVSAVRPLASSGRLERTVRRAAERARGLPGRFTRILWPGSGVAVGTDRIARRSHLSRVAEQPAVYGRDAALWKALHEDFVYVPPHGMPDFGA